MKPTRRVSRRRRACRAAGAHRVHVVDALDLEPLKRHVPLQVVDVGRRAGGRLGVRHAGRLQPASKQGAATKRVGAWQLRVGGCTWQTRCAAHPTAPGGDAYCPRTHVNEPRRLGVRDADVEGVLLVDGELVGGQQAIAVPAHHTASTRAHEHEHTTHACVSDWMMGGLPRMQPRRQQLHGSGRLTCQAR